MKICMLEQDTDSLRSNLTFYNSVTAISQVGNWGWTYKSVSVNNCSVGIEMTNGNANPLTVGSATLLDSSFTNTAVAILSDRVGGTSSPATAGILIIENAVLSNTPIAIKLGSSGATLLAGTTGILTIAGWGSGNLYNHVGPTTTQGSFAAPTRSASPLHHPRQSTIIALGHICLCTSARLLRQFTWKMSGCGQRIMMSRILNRLRSPYTLVAVSTLRVLRVFSGCKYPPSIRLPSADLTLGSTLLLSTMLDINISFRAPQMSSWARSKRRRLVRPNQICTRKNLTACRLPT